MDRKSTVYPQFQLRGVKNIPWKNLSPKHVGKYLDKVFYSARLKVLWGKIKKQAQNFLRQGIAGPFSPSACKIFDGGGSTERGNYCPSRLLAMGCCFSS